MRRRKIDDIDLKIIEKLRRDGRKKLTEIADELNMTHPSVHERIKKLVDNEIIKIQANFNLSKLRLKAAFVSLRMKDAKEIPKLIEKCSNCSKLLLMGFGSGKYNVFVILIGYTFDELRCAIEKKFSSRNIEEMIVSYGEISILRIYLSNLVQVLARSLMKYALNVLFIGQRSVRDVVAF